MSVFLIGWWTEILLACNIDRAGIGSDSDAWYRRHMVSRSEGIGSHLCYFGFAYLTLLVLVVDDFASEKREEDEDHDEGGCEMAGWFDVCGVNSG